MIKFSDDMTMWEINGRQVNTNIPKPIEAQYYEEQSIVLFLVGREENGPVELLGYDVNGQELFNISRPVGYSFEYLTTHPKASLAIVCGVVESENPDEAWSDYYFAIDRSYGSLTRLCVAR